MLVLVWCGRRNRVVFAILDDSNTGHSHNANGNLAPFVNQFGQPIPLTSLGNHPSAAATQQPCFKGSKVSRAFRCRGSQVSRANEVETDTLQVCFLNQTPCLGKQETSKEYLARRKTQGDNRQSKGQ